MKILYSTWFTSFNLSLGVVVIENEDGVRKAYLGRALGLDQEADENNIVENGCKVHESQLEEVLNLLKQASKKE